MDACAAFILTGILYMVKIMISDSVDQKNFYQDYKTLDELFLFVDALTTKNFTIKFSPHHFFA